MQSRFMAKITFSIYSDILAQSPNNSDQLFIELGQFHVACLVKLGNREGIAAFELFDLEEQKDWDDIFYEIRTLSRILDRSYTNTKVYINLPEAVLIPLHKYNREAGAEFVELIHGQHKGVVYYTDVISPEPNIAVSFRVPHDINEMVNRNFLMVTVNHVYSTVIAQVMDKGSVGNKLYVQCYAKHIIVAAYKEKQLQLIQSFSFATNEDVLYHLLNLCKQIQMNAVETGIVISGILDLQSQLFAELKKLFASIEVAEVATSFQLTDSNNPAHYFTPFFNLTV